MKKVYRLVLIVFASVFFSSCGWLNTEGISMSHHSDEAITSAVNNGLMANKVTAGAPIQVETHEGVVSLSGYVRTIRQNDEANEVASQVSGVKNVENNLVVRQ